MGIPLCITQCIHSTWNVHTYPTSGSWGGGAENVHPFRKKSFRNGKPKLRSLQQGRRANRTGVIYGRRRPRGRTTSRICPYRSHSPALTWDLLHGFAGRAIVSPRLWCGNQVLRQGVGVYGALRGVCGISQLIDNQYESYRVAARSANVACCVGRTSPAHIFLFVLQHFPLVLQAFMHKTIKKKDCQMCRSATSGRRRGTVPGPVSEISV